MTDQEQKDIFARNLQFYLDRSAKTQREVADAIGVSPQTFNTWTQAIAIPRMPKMQKLVDYLGIKVTDLVDPKPLTAVTTKVTSIRIPVLGSVAAGIPISAITDIVDWEEIPESMASDGSEYYGLKLKGNSMLPEMRSGDVVIVRAQSEADSGDIVIVQVNGDTEATCKRLIKYKDGITLMPLNSEYPPMQYTAEEVISSPVHIIGKVVEVRRKF